MKERTPKTLAQGNSRPSAAHTLSRLEEKKGGEGLKNEMPFPIVLSSAFWKHPKGTLPTGTGGKAKF